MHQNYFVPESCLKIPILERGWVLHYSRQIPILDRGWVLHYSRQILILDRGWVLHYSRQIPILDRGCVLHYPRQIPILDSGWVLHYSRQRVTEAETAVVSTGIPVPATCEPATCKCGITHWPLHQYCINVCYLRFISHEQKYILHFMGYQISQIILPF